MAYSLTKTFRSSASETNTPQSHVSRQPNRSSKNGHFVPLEVWGFESIRNEHKEDRARVHNQVVYFGTKVRRHRGTGYQGKHAGWHLSRWEYLPPGFLREFPGDSRPPRLQKGPPLPANASLRLHADARLYGERQLDFLCPPRLRSRGFQCAGE